MRLLSRLVSALLLCALGAVASPALADPNPDWTTPLPPFRIAGNLYYVGTRDLASYLIATPQGLILLNANLESNVPQIEASVAQLGFHFADIKILLNSQAHFDHSAGNAQVLRLTHAKLMVMDGDVQTMETGGRADFDAAQVGPFPPAHVDRILHDGDTVTLGGAILTAHKTAGHTRGCTTWTLLEPDPGPNSQARPLHVVIAGGWAPLSGYRLIDTPGMPASYPGIAQDFERGYELQLALPCDIFLGAHGIYFDLLGKLARLPKEGPAVWIDPEGFRREVREAQADFQKELAQQRAAAQ